MHRLCIMLNKGIRNRDEYVIISLVSPLKLSTLHLQTFEHPNAQKMRACIINLAIPTNIFC